MVSLDLPTREDFESLRSAIADLHRKLDGLSGDGWRSIPETAEARGVTEATVQRWVREGLFEARGAGKAREVRPAR